MRTITEISQLLQKLDHVVSAPPNSRRKRPTTLTDKTLATRYTNILRVIETWIQQISFTGRTSKIISKERRYKNNLKLKSIRNKITQLRNHCSKKLSSIRTEANEIQENSMKLIRELASPYGFLRRQLINEGKVLIKQAFTDISKMSHVWPLCWQLENCVCRQKFNIGHSSITSITIMHNQVRDTTPNFLKIICNNVKIEPSVLPVSGKRLPEKTANILYG